MIYDGHAYCIPDQKGDGGFADRKEFHRLLQFLTAHHFQPARRARDRAPADSSGLADLSRPFDLNAVKDANFRPTAHGRFEWEVDGETYFKQVMPPLVTDMTYTADMLVAEMDYSGVDWSLLHRTPYLGISNDFIADCCKQYPDRIQGLAYVREWLIPKDPDAAVQEVERSVNKLGLHGLQFMPHFSILHGVTEDWDSGGYRPFWDAVARMNIPVFFTLIGLNIARQDKTLEGYLNQLRMLRRWMERYPDVKVVLTHGFNWLNFVEGDKLSVPEAVYETAPCDNPNFHIQLLFVVFLGGVFDYPMPQVKPTLEKMTHLMGAERLLWGTDIPLVLRSYTYRQCLDHIRRYCDDFLNQKEMDLILGGNMARLMGVESA